VYDVRTRKRGQDLGRSAVDVIAGRQSKPRVRVFDYERKLAPEVVRDAYPEFVPANPIFNPQPVTPIQIEFVATQVKSARSGLISLITNQQAKASEKTKSTIALTKVRKGVLGRVAYHSPGFGIPQKAKELPPATPLTLLDRIFEWINSRTRGLRK